MLGTILFRVFLSCVLLSKDLEINIREIIMLPVVLCGCDTWSVTLRGEHELRGFENRVLRKIFVPKWVEGAEYWRRPHNEELHNFYASPNIIRVMKSRRMCWVVHTARTGEIINAYKI
jgi:hypothetical protein